MQECQSVPLTTAIHLNGFVKKKTQQARKCQAVKCQRIMGSWKAMVALTVPHATETGLVPQLQSCPQSSGHKCTRITPPAPVKQDT